MLALLLLLSLCFIQQVTSWDQQFSNSRSDSSVMFYVAENPYTTGWTVALKGVYDNDSHMYGPSADYKGIIYLPLLQIGIGVSVNAVNSTGNVIWNYFVDCSECQMVSNIVYSLDNDYVFFACGPMTAKNASDNQFNVYAVSAFSGELIWSRQLPSGQYTKCLSLTDDVLIYFAERAVFTSGKYYCVLYLNLKNGSTVSGSEELCNPAAKYGYMQTKITYPSLIIPLLLFTDYNSHSVHTMGYTSDSNTFLPIWKSNLPSYSNYLDLHINYAFGSDIIYASSSFVTRDTIHSGTYYVFALNISTGALVFNSTGQCGSTSSLVSPPVVDMNGIAYYSCGNQLFSVYPNGNLRWKTVITTSPYTAEEPPLPLSFCLQKGVHVLYLALSPQQTIYVVSMNTGKIIDKRDLLIPENCQIIHPPIVIANLFFYVVYTSDQNTISVTGYSVKT